MKYDLAARQPLQRYLTYQSKVWKNLPGDRIAAAFTWPTTNKTYVFQRNLYYALDNARHIVEYRKPGYPRVSSKYWLGCGSATSRLAPLRN